jgi:RHS repeat-associated protein
MRTFLCSLFASLALFATNCACFAQTNPNLETGFKPFGSYDETSFDSVSITNGDLSLHIPMFDYPQRGYLSARVQIVYHGKGWQAFMNCAGTSCTSFWRPSNLAMVQVQLESDEIGTSYRNVNIGSTVVQMFTAVENDGSTHQLASRASGGYESIDGSGIYFNGSLTAPVLLNRGGAGFRSTSIVNWQDTNGNYLNSYLGNGQNTAPTPHIDTLGRSLPATTVDDGSGSTGCATGTGYLPIASVSIGAYLGPNAAQRLIKTCSVTVTLLTGFNAIDFDPNGGQHNIQEYSGTISAIQSIVFYNGNSWTTSPQWSFQYAPNAYGDLTQVSLPTGGTIKYSWGTTTLCGNQPVTPKSRIVLSRTINANDGKGDQTTTYNGGTVTDPAGNDTVHGVTGINGTCSYYETSTSYYSGTGASRRLLKNIQTAYTFTTNPFDQWGDGAHTVANVKPSIVTTTIPIPGGSNSLVSQVQTDYDSTFNFSAHTSLTSGGSYGLLKEKREYAYGLNAPGPLVRRTVYTNLALSNSNYLNANLLTPVSQVTVYDGSGNMVSQTTNTYDGTSLQSSGISVGHNSLANPGYRGNLTQVQKWLNTTGTNVTTAQAKYYDTGMPYQSIDLKNNATTYTYNPTAYYGAYLTQTQYPNTGSGITHIIQGAYDFNTGLLTSFTDQNNQVSSYGYDVLGRINSAAYPDGGSVIGGYTDSVPVQITKTVKVTSSLNKVSNTIFDGLGRASQTQFHDPDCTAGSQLIKTDHTYGFDFTQNTSFTTATSPYCDTPGSIFGLATRTDSDSLGRTVKTTDADNSVATSSYAADGTLLLLCTTATDEQGKARKSCSDALGRLTKVWEDPSGLNYETDYSYNTLDNMVSVTQKGGDPNSANWRPRSFVYDSLSRLTSATNPESGNITYTYSNSSSGCSVSPGTVCTKTAPAPNATSGSGTVTTTYFYDNLDRLTKKTYNDIPLTATVSYGYDADTTTLTCANAPALTDSYPKTQRTAMCDASGATSWAHDQMGRVTTEKRLINGSSAITNSIVYTFNSDGSTATVTYPSSRKITYTPNSLSGYTAGRPVSAVDTANSINYVTAAKYAPQGGLSSLSNGASINGAVTYNNRLQPLQMYYTTGAISQTTLNQLQTSTCPTAVAALMSTNYNFGLGTNDNGNVQSIANCRNTNRTQNFGYDSLNRIFQAYSSGPSWGEDFTIDAWGNLTNRSLHVGKTNYELLNAAPATNNRLTGYGYDIAGNIINNGTATYTYDAENRVISTAGVTYTYDGDGNRVKKSNGTLYWGTGPLVESDLSGNSTSWKEYVFFAGKRVARRDASNGTVHYFFDDHLGSTSVVTNSTGSTLEEDLDYYPYGGIASGTSSDHYLFNGKERDNESGLDEFGARYYGSSLGRFMIPDWAAKPTSVPYANFGNPQSLNLYSYVENNPTTMGDPDGHGWIDPEALTQELTDVAVGAGKGLWNMAAGTWNTGAQLLNDQGAASGQPHIELQMLPTATYDNATQAVSGGVTQLGAVVAGGVEGAARGSATEAAEAGVPDANVVVRGGQGEIPASGTYSGAHGATVEEAASGVPHGTIRTSTAGEIRGSGGTVTSKPEPAYPGGPVNQQHVNINGGQKTFGPPRSNPVPKAQRVPSAPKIKKPNETGQ